MAKKYDVVAVTGKYTDSNGQEKSRYMNIGAVINTRNGFMLKLEGVPVGWDGWAYLNEPKERQEPQRGGAGQRGPASPKRQPAQQQDFGSGDDFADEEIPF